MVEVLVREVIGTIREKRWMRQRVWWRKCNCFMKHLLSEGVKEDH